MTTLAGTFKYGANVDKAPIKELILDFSCPNFAYIEAAEVKPNIARQILPPTETTIQLELSADHYRAELPAKNIIGLDDKTIERFLAYTIQSLSNDATSIENLSMTIGVHFLALSSFEIHFVPIRAIYVIRDFEQLLREGAALAGRCAATLPAANIRAFLEKNLFFINADVYDEVLVPFKTLSGSSKNFPLLNILHRLLSIVDVLPDGTLKFGDSEEKGLVEILRNEHIEPRREVLDLIAKNFGRLLAFPLAVAEIKAIVVAGNFRVKTPDSSKITKEDLTFYDLSVDYSTMDAAGITQPHRIQIDWQKNQNPINNNTVSFSFGDMPPIFLSALRGAVAISVKGFESSLLWSKEFLPEDPGLEKLSIEVDLLRPNRLIPSTDSRPSGARLRGWDKSIWPP